MRRRIAMVASAGLGAGLLISGATPAQGLPDRFRAGETYANAMPGPAVLGVQADWTFGVGFGSLDSVRRELVRKGYVLDLKITDRSVSVGQLSGGRCVRTDPPSDAGSWTWREAPSDWLASRSWSATGRGTIQINEGGGFIKGERPCVIQEIFWRARGFSGVTFLSRPTPTASGLPAPLSETLPDAGSDPVPGAPDIVLPDLDLPSDDGGARPQLGTIASFDLNRDAIQRVLDRIRDATNPTIQNPGSSSASSDPASRLGTVQVPVLLPEQQAAQANLRQQGQAAIAEAQASLGAATGSAASSAQHAQLTQLVQEASAVVASVEAEIPIAGGRVPQRDLSLVTGVNLARAPVTGFNGRAKVGSVVLTVTPAKVLGSGISVRIPVSVSPRSTSGRVILTLLRKTTGGIYVAARGATQLRNGKATVGLRIPKGTPKGTYSIVVSFRQTNAKEIGVTALRTVTLR